MSFSSSVKNDASGGVGEGGGDGDGRAGGNSAEKTFGVWFSEKTRNEFFFRCGRRSGG